MQIKRNLPDLKSLDEKLQLYGLEKQTSELLATESVNESHIEKYLNEVLRAFNGRLYEMPCLTIFLDDASAHISHITQFQMRTMANQVTFSKS